ncbi:MAG: DUF58 domain-containing protein, partial [Saprospiraceae bacterium]
NFTIKASVIDEIPEEFQIRDFNIITHLNKGKMTELPYQIRPTFRGLVDFGNTHVYVSSPLKLAQRKYTFDTKKGIPVYPSFLQLKKYEFLAFSNRILQHGLKKVRRLGHTMEFEKIKEYVPGDDIRTVNWKSTAKSNKLMVNLYQDERSQSIYCILDAGRVMKMPFEGLSLLDYAINAILVLSSIALRKQDYAGFFSFSKRIENRVASDRRTYQMKRIMEALYNVKTDYYESDYSRLFRDIKKNIPQRSLLLLFTNFETIDGLQRQLPYLKAIARSHLLIIIFFHNTEMDTILHTRSEDTAEIFDKIIAEKLHFEKKLIVQELQKFGIHTILTKPEHLTIDTINMYLEIKAKGMI